MYNRIIGHYQTVWPHFARKLVVGYERERITTPDDDFLDLDWLRRDDRKRLIILSHGLEGTTINGYVVSAARYFERRGWDILAWNCRSCSGEMNRAPKLYSHGQSEDLATVVDHALSPERYERIVLIGFSMGGNLTLKYLGKAGAERPPQVTHGVSFSAPCFLEPAVDALERRDNWIYKRRFLKSLMAKVVAKETQFPGMFDLDALSRVKVWRDFDELTMRPLSGKTTFAEYYHYLSSGNFVTGTTAPVLIVNAVNDPIVPPACVPGDLGRGHRLITIERPRRGGHVGFDLRGKDYNRMDERAAHFLGP